MAPIYLEALKPSVKKEHEYLGDTDSRVTNSMCFEWVCLK